MFCSKCGKEVIANAKFCANCGQPVASFQMPAPKAEPAPVVVEEPTPVVVEAPAPVAAEPVAEVAAEPAVAEPAPAPVYEQPAPAPAPVYEQPAPQPAPQATPQYTYAQPEEKKAENSEPSFFVKLATSSKFVDLLAHALLIAFSMFGFIIRLAGGYGAIPVSVIMMLLSAPVCVLFLIAAIQEKKILNIILSGVASLFTVNILFSLFTIGSSVNFYY